MSQADAFLHSEGDAWYLRNKDKPRDTRVLDAIERNGIVPRRVLEVGCGNGWQLAELIKKYDCVACGLEPSMEALKDGMVPIYNGTAVEMGTIFAGSFDLIIFGFCLYLVDRKNLLSIAGQTDDLLEDGGRVIIHDFCSVGPYRRAYEHKEGLFSYKQDYSKLWTGNPAYKLIEETDYGTTTPHPTSWDDIVTVQVLKKDMDAWPLKEPT